MSVEQVLKTFIKRIEQQSKSNLAKSKKKDTGELYNSIKGTVQVHKNSFTLKFVMEDYGTFIDKGVKGVKSSAKAPNSPFKFGSGSGESGGLTKGINGWVQRKRIQFQNEKTGRFMSYKQTAGAIINSIWNKGIRTTNFFTKPFKNEFAKLPGDVVEAYGLEVTSFLEYTFKK